MSCRSPQIATTVYRVPEAPVPRFVTSCKKLMNAESFLFFVPSPLPVTSTTGFKGRCTLGSSRGRNVRVVKLADCDTTAPSLTSSKVSQATGNELVPALAGALGESTSIKAHVYRQARMPLVWMTLSVYRTHGVAPFCMCSTDVDAEVWTSGETRNRPSCSRGYLRVNAQRVCSFVWLTLASSEEAARAAEQLGKVRLIFGCALRLALSQSSPSQHLCTPQVSSTLKCFFWHLTAAQKNSADNGLFTQSWSASCGQQSGQKPHLPKR